MPAARFTVICAECIRIEYSRSGRFVDAPSMFAVCRGVEHLVVPQREVIVQDEAGSPPAVIQTQRVTLTFTPDGSGFNAGTLTAKIRGPFAPGGPEGDVTEWSPDSTQTGNLGGTLCTLDGMRYPEPLPQGLLSTDGWFLLDDSKQALLIDGWVKMREAVGLADNIDWYLFAYGADYPAALAALALVGGAVPMPRRYLLGSWYSRYWPHSSAEFREIVEEYRSHNLPLDVVVLDMDWHRDGWTGWSWNRDLLPDAEELLSWFRERRIAVTLNLHPADGVGPHEDRYPEFMRAIGRDPASGDVVPFDAGNRRYMTALFDHIHAPLERDGVDFWWLDWQQDRYVRSIPGLTNLQWLNRLYFRQTASEGRRGVSFSRWAGWGDHRYPIHFSGDAHTGWEMLAFQVPFTSTAGNVGCFYWSHDIGGHFGPRDEEATTRWVQFGALSAALRLHSARTGALDRRPWTYKPPMFQAMKDAFSLRSRLMPYIYTQARLAYDRTVPLLRPMYIDFPREPRAYQRPLQFMLGDAVLVAPIVTPGVGPHCVSTQAVWFPGDARSTGSGADPGWYRWNTGTHTWGDDEAIVAATLDEIPLYVRGGVPIPLQDAATSAAAGSAGRAIVRLWPGAPGQTATSELYEDDGVTRGYQDGLFARTPLTAQWSAAEGGRLSLRLFIGPAEGRFDGQIDTRPLRIELAGLDSATRAILDHHPSDSHAWEPRDGVLGLDIAVRSIRTQTVVECIVQPADHRHAAVTHAARRLSAAYDWQPPAALDGLEPLEREIKHGVASLAARPELGATRVLAIGAGIGFIPSQAVAVEGCPPRPQAFQLCDTFGWLDGRSARVEIVDRHGDDSTTVSHQDLDLARRGRTHITEIAAAPGPLVAPPVGLLATRTIRAEASIDGRPVSLSLLVEQQRTPITHWRIIGPFDWDWTKSVLDQVASPEHGGLEPSARHTGRGGEDLGWKASRSGDHWPLDFRVGLGHHQGLAYAVTRLVSPAKQAARLVVDATDKIEAWLNGHKVYSQDGFDTQASVDAGAPIELLEGDNTLLIKCASGGHGWGCSIAIDGHLALKVDPNPRDQASGGHA